MPETPATPALPEVERSVLGGMLVFPERAAKPVIEAGAGIFDKPQYEAIFKTLEYLYEHGEPIDQLTVAARLEKARLYLSLEPGLCTIRKAKIWRNKAVNPNGLSLGFSIVNGCTIIPDSGGWRKE